MMLISPITQKSEMRAHHMLFSLNLEIKISYALSDISFCACLLRNQGTQSALALLPRLLLLLPTENTCQSKPPCSYIWMLIAFHFLSNAPTHALRTSALQRGQQHRKRGKLFFFLCEHTALTASVRVAFLSVCVCVWGWW